MDKNHSIDVQHSEAILMVIFCTFVVIACALMGSIN